MRTSCSRARSASPRKPLTRTAVNTPCPRLGRSTASYCVLVAEKATTPPSLASLMRRALKALPERQVTTRSNRRPFAGLDGDEHGPADDRGGGKIVAFANAHVGGQELIAAARVVIAVSADDRGDGFGIARLAQCRRQIAAFPRMVPWLPKLLRKRPVVPSQSLISPSKAPERYPPRPVWEVEALRISGRQGSPRQRT